MLFSLPDNFFDDLIISTHTKLNVEPVFDHPTQTFISSPISVADVHKSLTKLECKKWARPDKSPKTWDHTDLNNYHLIHILSLLTTHLPFFYDQLKHFLSDNSNPKFQWGYKSANSNVTAAMLITNDVVNSFDVKQRISIFITICLYFLSFLFHCFVIPSLSLRLPVIFFH